MSEDQAGEDSEAKEGGGKGLNIIVWGVIFCLGIGTGVGTAILVAPGAMSSGTAQETNELGIPEPEGKPTFLEFDEVVVNLNDTRYSRYVTCNFSLQVAESQQEAIQKLLDENEAILMNWLISHLREKKLDDVRGKYGHNALRREIHGKFNELLFSDGVERIQDVLFQDFKVQ